MKIKTKTLKSTGYTVLCFSKTSGIGSLQAYQRNNFGHSKIKSWPKSLIITQFNTVSLQPNSKLESLFPLRLIHPLKVRKSISSEFLTAVPSLCAVPDNKININISSQQHQRRHSVNGSINPYWFITETVAVYTIYTDKE